MWVTGDLCFSYITSGSRGWAKYYADSGALFLRMGNLDHGTTKLDLSDIQRVSPPHNTEGTRTRVQPGDILISITADVGMVALSPQDIGEAYINQHVALARPIDGLCPQYIAWFLDSRDGGQKQFINLQRGATKVGLGLDDIRAVNISLPALLEQSKIIDEIERHFSVADEVEKVVEQSLKQAGRLRQSILRTAFQGKLVPQDPNDEPAEKLLERTKEEKAKKELENKNKKTKKKLKKLELTCHG